MSNNAAVPKDQPSTTAKIIIVTNSGELQIQLWAKQIPLACRNFIQLALQGYYDGTIFHRMIPGFMIQGGDPSGTGTGGESIYGAPFKDQFHQRIKFGRRGMVAMANTGKDSNNSQFFITFDQTPHLNKKHTIFGKVVGDSVYKLLQFQSLETNKQDRPIYPPTIRKIRVVLNPFDDIIPRSTKKNEEMKQYKQQTEQQQKKTKKIQIKKLKNKNKLTFQEDGAEQDEVVVKIKSSHDTLNDDKLLKKVAVTQQQLERKRKAKLQQKQKMKQIAKKIHEPENQTQNVEGIQSIVKAEMLKKKKNAQGNTSTQVNDEVLNYKKKVNKETGKVEIVWEDNSDEQNQQNDQNNENARMQKLRELQQQQYEALRADELNFKKLKQGSAKQRRKQLVAQQKTLLSNAQKKRYEYLKKNHVEKRESDVMSRLKKFTDRLVQSNPGDWMCHSLKFHIDSQNAYSLDKKNQENKGRQDDDDDGGLKIEYENNNIDNDEINIEELYELAAREDQNQGQNQGVDIKK